MKICIALEKFDPSVGGAERYCWDLAHFLVEQGHEVVVICMKAGGEPHPSILIRPVSAIRFPQFLRHLSFALLHCLEARRMRDFIHFCVGNTFFMDFYQPHGGVHRAWFLRETSLYREPARTLIRLFRRLSPKDMIQRAMEWWVLGRTRPHVIAISEMVADDMERFFQYPRSMLQLVPNGIDLERYSPGNGKYRGGIRQRYGIGPDEFVFLFVAQNPRLKGYDVLLKACRDLGQLPFKVLVIGQCETWMRRAARHLGDRVIFAGRADDLHKVYPSCDCLVHPTYYDACSLVVLESIASGTPVITTYANGASMFIDSSNGAVIEPGDVRGLSSAMRDVMADRRSRVGIGTGLVDQRTTFSRLEKCIQEYGE